MIKVFGSTDKDFSSNGDVIIKPYKAIIHKEDNADFYLDLECDTNYSEYLAKDNIVIAPTPQGDQPFRIDNPEKTGTMISFRAKHVFFDSLNYLIQDTYVVEKDADKAIKQLNNATEPTSEFAVGSNISTVASYRCVRESLYNAIQILLERYGGHLVRDGFSINLRETIGEDTGLTIRYAKNLEEISAQENWDDVVTKILPVGKDGILLNALDSSESVYITSSVQYPVPYTKTVSFEQDINRDDYSSETAYKRAVIADLRRQATSYLNENCYPKVNYTLKADVNRVVDLGDRIEVIDQRLGIDLFTNVIAYEYDCNLGKYVTVEFGNFKPTLSGLIPSITTSVNKTITKATDALQNEIDNINAPVASSQLPLMDGTASAGTGINFSRYDHVHPHDSTKQDVLLAGSGIIIENNVISAHELPVVTSADDGKVLKVVGGQWVATTE